MLVSKLPLVILGFVYVISVLIQDVDSSIFGWEKFQGWSKQDLEKVMMGKHPTYAPFNEKWNPANEKLATNQEEEEEEASAMGWAKHIPKDYTYYFSNANLGEEKQATNQGEEEEASAMGWAKHNPKGLPSSVSCFNPSHKAFGDFCYYFELNPPFSMLPNPRDRCIKRGMDLASIHSPEENDFIAYNFPPGRGRKWLIGLSRGRHGFTWLDGTPVDFTNWLYRTPAYATGYYHFPTFGVQMSGTGTWKETQGSFNYDGIICKTINKLLQAKTTMKWTTIPSMTTTTTAGKPSIPSIVAPSKPTTNTTKIATVAEGDFYQMRMKYLKEEHELKMQVYQHQLKNEIEQDLMYLKRHQLQMEVLQYQLSQVTNQSNGSSTMA